MWRVVGAAIVGAFGASVEAADNDLRYAFVFGDAVAMEKQPQFMAFAAPDGSEILLDSCGFARMTYNVGPLLVTQDNYPDEFERESFLYVMGHWCEVAPALFEERGANWHLIAYSERSDGVKIMHYYAAVHWDATGLPYVADTEFLELVDLEVLLRSIEHGPNDTGCTKEPDAAAPTDGRTLVEGVLCFARGVYLADIAAQQNAGSVPQ